MTIQADFLEQAVACEALGSPFTGKICRLFAQNLSRRCLVSERLLDWRGDTSYRGQSVPLRMASALHAMVLSGRSQLLASVYPPKVKEAGENEIWQAVEHAMLSEEDFVLDWLSSPPQTNEPARSGALWAGFQKLVSLIDKPLVMSEVGASAGLNLNWDKYALYVNGRRLGAGDAALSFSPEWTGGQLPEGPAPVVRDREGCDLNPVDVRDPNMRLRLMAYLWPDQPDRVDRMKLALSIAEKSPPRVVRADALDWLKQRLAELHSGAIHVIYSTVAWQYLEPDARKAGAEMISRAGLGATENAPLVWLKMEGDGKPEGAALTLQIWPGGEEIKLARVDFHGRWISWIYQP